MNKDDMKIDNTRPVGGNELLNRALAIGTNLLKPFIDSLKHEEGKLLHMQLVRHLIAQPQHGQALTLLGTICWKGCGVKKDYTKAIEFFEQAISLRHAGAIYSRAVMHQVGEGGPINYPAAAKLFDQAISLGDPGAMHGRSWMHCYGQGDQVNFPVGIELLEQAIARGHAGAMYTRAVMHDKGRGGPVNLPAAIELYEQASLLGDGYSICNRALMHLKGRGGPVNYPAAIALLDQAISLGLPLAMFMRAEMHLKGHGEPEGQKNPISAARLYLKAVKTGASPYKEKALMALCELEGSPEHSKSPEIQHLFVLTMYYNDANYSHAEALNYFQQLSTDHKSLLDLLKDAEEIAMFGEFQIQIAERALLESSELDDDDATAKRDTAQSALEFAEAAREKLQTFSDTPARILHDQLHERLLMTLHQDRMPLLQTDVECFANTLSELLHLPTSTRVNVMLMDVVFVAHLEPYFSPQEKHQLLLILASLADPSGQDSAVQILATQAKSKLESNQLSNGFNSIRIITFDYLVGLATDIMLNQNKTSQDRSLANLQELLLKASHYNPELEQELLRHPWVLEVLIPLPTTYENALTKSLLPEQKNVSLADLKHELLQRLEDLGSYYQAHPEKFNSVMLKKDAVRAADSPRLFHAACSNANSKIISERENFAAFRRQLKGTLDYCQ